MYIYESNNKLYKTQRVILSLIKNYENCINNCGFLFTFLHKNFTGEFETGSLNLFNF